MKAVLEAIKLPTPGNSTPYFSEGDFSMHELIEHLLKQTGPAKVVLSSFSINEHALRVFCELRESGTIQGLACLFDFTVKSHKKGLLYFATKIASTIAIAKCHAKIILIQNGKHYITVVSSANLNINDKIEAGIISADPAIFDYYQAKLCKAINDGIPITENDYK